MQKEKKIILQDVTILRPIAILLLVVYHAFIIYTGGWKLPSGYVDVEAYKWIADISYSFMLQLFVMLSGYVFSFQMNGQKRNFTLKKIVLSKFKRLILPSIVFSVIYFFFFKEYTNSFSFWIDILSGVGHMWFLPMLFWCFIGGYLLTQMSGSEMVKLLICTVIPLFSILPLRFGIAYAFNYLFFFYLGMVLFKKRLIILRNNRCYTILLLGISFVVVFLLYQYVFSTIKDSNFSFFDKIIKLLLFKYGQLLYALLGTLFAWFIVNFILATNKIIPQWIIKFNSSCFGIYLFQQFILQYLYYKTDLPLHVGAYWLPWTAFILTIILSYFLTVVVRKSKFGRALVG